MEFNWDDARSERTLHHRGFDFAFASRLFEGPVDEFIDDRTDYGEARIIAFGIIDGLSYAVVYTIRDEVRWIISAFRVRSKELERWKGRGTAVR